MKIFSVAMFVWCVLLAYWNVRDGHAVWAAIMGFCAAINLDAAIERWRDEIR